MGEGDGSLWGEHLQLIQQIAAANADKPGGLLPILHEIQRKLGFIPDAGVPTIAEALNLSRAEINGVISFYHLFRTNPPGRRTLYLCRAEACQSMGGRALEKHVKSRLGVGFHETTSDGEFTLEPIYCLGNCACAPAVMIDRDVYGRLTPQRLDEVLGQVAEQAST